jgi:hypothetical protein
LVSANENSVPLNDNPSPAEYVVLLSCYVNVKVVPSYLVAVNVVPLRVMLFTASGYVVLLSVQGTLTYIFSPLSYTA